VNHIDEAPWQYRAATIAVILLIGNLGAATPEKQLEELQQLRHVLPSCPAFDQWLHTFASLPPDFDGLATDPYPQDLLPRRLTAAEWPARRKELAGLVEEYLLGHAPPAPGNVSAVIEEKKEEEGRQTWIVRLEFGPDHGAKLHCSLWLPPGFHNTPMPVFLVDNTNYTQFVRDALGPVPDLRLQRHRPGLSA